MSRPLQGALKESVTECDSHWILPFSLIYFYVPRKGSPTKEYAHEKICACDCNRVQRDFRPLCSSRTCLPGCICRAEPGDEQCGEGLALPLLEWRLGLRLGSQPLVEPSPLGFGRLVWPWPPLEPPPPRFLVALVSYAAWTAPSGAVFVCTLFLSSIRTGQSM